jgi:drug/metabolite transporter (DMT)-like permease
MSAERAALGGTCTLLPWDRGRLRRRWPKVPTFLLVSSIVVFVTGAGFSAGFYFIAVANAVLVLGSRWAIF